MKKHLISLILLTIVTSLYSQQLPKKEFRGAWIHTVGNRTIPTLTTEEVKNLFINILDSLHLTGNNAVIFQVRPQADAFYPSSLEPWSRFLTGEQGKAPDPIWDPLQFMIEESHKRGMELHAWCNPYRVTSNEEEVLCPDHIYFKEPEIFVKYGKQIYFDPGEPRSREITIGVIADMVRRYDLDAIHFDDYFYPYPVDKIDFPDTKSFKKYHKQQGFKEDQIADWRRNNVSLLIKELNDTIKAIKPWVRFGISPFGIHRNDFNTPDGSGSKTNGLSNYEQLFADVPLWAQEGWIDYVVPQIYWKIGHPLACYEILINWWNDLNCTDHLYIGQNISTFTEPDIENPKRTQMAKKMHLVRSLENVTGNTWWPGWSIVRNTNSIADSLIQTYQKDLALIPPYSKLDNIRPEPVSNIEFFNEMLIWDDDYNNDPMQEALFYALYSFPKGTKVDIENSKYLTAILQKRYITINDLKDKYGAQPGTQYVITVIDRCWNESRASQSLIMN